MTMRRFLISAALLAAAAVSVATPAEAQYRNPGYGQGQGYGSGYGQGYGNGYGQFRGGGIQRELAEIRQQIRLGFDRGMISRGEVARLSRDADKIEQRLNRRAWDGLDGREREDLQRRVQALRERLRFERFDNRRDRRW
jgi:Spy/CpxP family protein refolding chaperone